MTSVNVVEWFFQILVAIGGELDSARFVISLSKQMDMKRESVSRVSCDELPQDSSHAKRAKEKRQANKARLGRYARILIDWWF